MGRLLRILITGIAVTALPAAVARADERAGWGVVVSVGTEGERRPEAPRHQAVRSIRGRRAG